MVDEQKTRSIISWLIASVPLIMMGLLLLVNGRYISALFVRQPPWLVVGLLPCGWLVVLGIVTLVLGARALLQWADGVVSFVWKWVIRGTAVALVLIALVLVTIAPALFLISNNLP